MADAALVRMVDDQYAQIRQLASLALSVSDANSRRALFCAAVRALHVCITAYFAELTQPRFDKLLWPKLLACHGSFQSMARLAKVGAQNVNEWLEAELDDQSEYARALAAISAINMPIAASYRSGLLSTTTLNDLASDALIATSARAPLLDTFDELMPMAQGLMSMIERQRGQNLEC